MNVTVTFAGTLVARTGTRSATVAVPADATVGDVLESVAERSGPQVTAGVLDGERLRSDTVVVRETADASEPLSAASSVDPGDTVHVRLRR